MGCLSSNARLGCFVWGNLMIGRTQDLLKCCSVSTNMQVCVISQGWAKVTGLEMIRKLHNPEGS